MSSGTNSSDGHASLSVENALCRTLNDVRLRSEVEDVVRQMVIDVEIANRLEEQVEARNVLERYRSKIREQELALAEARALQERRQRLQASLGDELVKELWSLSRQLGELEEIKLQHEELLVRHDEVVAKLIQTEEDLEDAKEQRQRQQQQRQRQERDRQEGKHAQQPLQMLPQDTTRTIPEESNASSEDGDGKQQQLQQLPKGHDADGSDANAATAMDVVVNEQQGPPNATSGAAGIAGATMAPAPASAPAPAVVALVEDDVEDRETTLTDLETPVLMHVFSYLDALDILNTAQVNISMYSRVDALFGLGPQNDSSAGAEDSSTIATTESMNATSGAAGTAMPAASTASSKPTSTATPTTAATTVASSASKTMVSTPTRSSRTATAATPQSSNTGGAKPPQQPTLSTAAASSSTATTTPAAAAAATRFDGPRALFSSIFDTRKATTPTSSPASRMMHHKRSASADAHQQGSGSGGASTSAAQPMNAAMANSMASKLTDAELNAIVLMTDRLKQKESLADRLLKENEALRAQMDGAEAMKDFLISRVSEMEQSLTVSEDNEAKVAQQIASDQEVIAFLDGRVQELEAEARRLEAEKATAASDLKRVKEQAEQKSVVMGDMLQFERERLAEQERDWKTTKKLLVREVKNCRAQIVALTAERDGLREQNEMLRSAVISSSPTPTAANGYGGGRDRFHS